MVDSNSRSSGSISWGCCCIDSRTRVLDHVFLWLPGDVHSDTNAWPWTFKTVKVDFGKSIYNRLSYNLF